MTAIRAACDRLFRRRPGVGGWSNDRNLFPATLNPIEGVRHGIRQQIGLACRRRFCRGRCVAAPRKRGPAPTPQFTAEKCYGIAAASQNDCQTATHSCAGESKQARDANSWVYVPVGTCAKIAGGSLKRA